MEFERAGHDCRLWERLVVRLESELRRVGLLLVKVLIMMTKVRRVGPMHCPFVVMVVCKYLECRQKGIVHGEIIKVDGIDRKVKRREERKN
jgi:hypothetical protein